MSSDAALETEDFDNGQFVRMQDIQPRITEDVLDDVSENSPEVLETCIVDDGNVEDCMVDDNDSNIGSIVSLQSEDVDRIELIVPEVLDEDQEGSQVFCDDDPEVEYLEDPDSQDVDHVDYLEEAEESDGPEADQVLEPPQDVEEHDPDTQDTDCLQEADVPVYEAAVAEDAMIPKQIPPTSWPTLEILPGGVINLIADRGAETENKARVNKMMYACAKCPQSFRHLFCLVKHVKWHEDEERKINILKRIPPIAIPEDVKRKCDDTITDKKLKKQKAKLSATEAAKAVKKHSPAVKKRNRKVVPKKN